MTLDPKLLYFHCFSFPPMQVQGAYCKHRHDPCYRSCAVTESASAPSTFTRSATSHRNRRYQRMPPRPKVHPTSHYSMPLACEEPDEQEQWPDQQHPDSWTSHWTGNRSGSLFSLPNMGSASSRSACSSPGPCPSPNYRSHSLHRSSSLIPPFRLNVDALIGAEETDVDTGNKVNPGSSVDLTVVSAYVKSSLPQTPRPLSAPPEDIGPLLSPVTQEGTYKSATLGRTPNSFSIKSSQSALQLSCPQSTSANTLSSASVNESDSCSIISVPVEEKDTTEEEEQEFYI